MIVVDTSALVAIILREPGWEVIVPRLLADIDRIMSSVTMVETTMVLSRTYSDPTSVVEGHISSADIAITPVDGEQARLANHAFLAFGKGRHPARLNFGDCFSYAAAKALNAALLYVGDDFTKTDILAA